MTDSISAAARPPMSIVVRPLAEADLSEADRVMRLAFGTYLGLPDPLAFMGDASYVHPRFRADPTAAFAAEANGELVGSVFVSRWGSVGFFGPLTVRPDCWDRGVASRLMAPVQACFARWGTRHAGLFTFAQSVRHVGLYRRHGFHPRFLTAIMAAPTEALRADGDFERFARLAPEAQARALGECAALADAVLPGLDLSAEIRHVAAQGLGDTVLLRDGADLAGFAVCHGGPGSEAGSAACAVKFAAVRPGPNAARHFDRLVGACGALAAALGLPRVAAAVNTARHEAYDRMLELGFGALHQGVVMQRPNEPGYNRPGAWVLDDWR